MLFVSEMVVEAGSGAIVHVLACVVGTPGGRRGPRSEAVAKHVGVWDDKGQAAPAVAAACSAAGRAGVRRSHPLDYAHRGPDLLVPGTSGSITPPAEQEDPGLTIAATIAYTTAVAKTPAATTNHASRVSSPRSLESTDMMAHYSFRKRQARRSA